ncbi:hypothetical protein QLG13_08070 [Rhodococcus aetherivorans]|uniref:hypothetical protein n=1 Tax=Rhodococcus aetherivorans TaxID=191292 RepID=UPI003EBC1F0E
MATLQPAKYGKVVGRLMAIVGDGPDEDEYPVAGGYPDARPLTGSVTFTPRASTILVPGATPDPVTAFAHPVTAQLDQNGYLTLNGKRGVFLLCPSAQTNPSTFTYSVRYNVALDGRPVAAPTFDIELTEYIPGPDPENPDDGSTVIDLTEQTPAQPSVGVPIIRGPRGDSVTDVALSADGSALVFTISQLIGSKQDVVPMPALPLISDAQSYASISGSAATVATEKAEAAADSAAAAAASAVEASQYVGGVADNTITSAKIVDGAIMNVDINANAGIAQSKIANLVDDLAGKAPTLHTHTAINITDASTVGRSVLTAVDAAAARSAIGAGTSDLALGTTASTAKAGNYAPVAADISDATTVGRNVLKATDAAAARTAIGAGTSSLAIGTTSSTAMAGDRIQVVASLPGTPVAGVLYCIPE